MLGAFRSWMRQHRGLTESTLDVYQGILVGLCEKLGGHPVPLHRRSSARLCLGAGAGLTESGARKASSLPFARSPLPERHRPMPSGMEYAIPGFASWQLSSIPRFLVPEDVERVIGSCAGSANGLRDRAVILLLARLGLRASEVAGLTFADIDWDNGRIAVCGKGRRQEWLPLPQELGAAIRLYLRNSRPPLRVPTVFTTVLAPFRPLTRASVTHIVRSRSTPDWHQGPHQWRSRASALGRDRDASSGRIAGQRRRGPASSVSANDGSLCQGRLRSPFGDRAAVAGGLIMLTAHVERYVRLRQTLGFKLRDASRALRAFAAFAAARGDTSLRESTAVAWAAEAPSPNARSIRLRDRRHLARFLHAEDQVHEVPASNLFPLPKGPTLAVHLHARGGGTNH